MLGAAMNSKGGGFILAQIWRLQSMSTWLPRTGPEVRQSHGKKHVMKPDRSPPAAREPGRVGGSRVPGFFRVYPW